MTLIQAKDFDQIEIVYVPWNPGDACQPFGGTVYPTEQISQKRREMAELGWTAITGERGCRKDGVEIRFGRLNEGRLPTLVRCG